LQTVCNLPTLEKNKAMQKNSLAALYRTKQNILLISDQFQKKKAKCVKIKFGYVWVLPKNGLWLVLFMIKNFQQKSYFSFQ
jgi:hypothetical protein